MWIRPAINPSRFSVRKKERKTTHKRNIVVKRNEAENIQPTATMEAMSPPIIVRVVRIFNKEFIKIAESPRTLFGLLETGPTKCRATGPAVTQPKIDSSSRFCFPLMNLRVNWRPIFGCEFYSSRCGCCCWIICIWICVIPCSSSSSCVWRRLNLEVNQE